MVHLSLYPVCMYALLSTAALWRKYNVSVADASAETATVVRTVFTNIQPLSSAAAEYARWSFGGSGAKEAVQFTLVFWSAEHA